MLFVIFVSVLGVIEQCRPVLLRLESGFSAELHAKSGKMDTDPHVRDTDAYNNNNNNDNNNDNNSKNNNDDNKKQKQQRHQKQQQQQQQQQQQCSRSN